MDTVQTHEQWERVRKLRDLDPDSRARVLYQWVKAGVVGLKQFRQLITIIEES